MVNRLHELDRLNKEAEKKLEKTLISEGVTKQDEKVFLDKICSILKKENQIHWSMEKLEDKQRIVEVQDQFLQRLTSQSSTVENKEKPTINKQKSSNRLSPSV